jgi:glycosyltransferase involved in cell wall biosynthesis
MNLIINKLAATRSSKGVYRFFSGIMQNLKWDSEIKYVEPSRSKILDRTLDFSRGGSDKDIFWTPCLRGPVRIPNHVISVHDCINIEYIYKDDWRLSFFKKITQKIIGNSVKVVALSESTRSSFLQHFSAEDNKIIVIKFASDFDWIQKERSYRENSQLGTFLPSGAFSPYILMVTNQLIHKNNLRAVQALIKSNCKKLGVGLRIVGNVGLDEHKLLYESGIEFSMESQVSDSKLFDLYSNTLFLFSPSLSEGHNLPIGEALELNSNVLCSDIPAHREFYDGRVSFFNPLSIENMTCSINSSIDINGLWHPAAYIPKRSFKDVADDYQKLFLNVKQQYCR